MKILIVTTLYKERKAFANNHFQIMDQVPISQMYLEKTKIFNKFEVNPIEVGIINLENSGNIESAIKTTQALLYFEPDLVILSGICGGFNVSDFIKLGDIIIPEEIIYYEIAKINNSNIERRYKSIFASENIIEKVKRFAKDNVEKTKINGKPFNVYFNPIASGEKIVADKSFSNELIEYYPRIIGVEMEAFGVASAVNKFRKPIQFIIVKSISDWADSTKNDDWHDMAAKISADFIISLIKNLNFD